MSGLLRSAVFVSTSGAVSQSLTLLTQIVIARLFGAGAALDAFIAAVTVPQYVVAVAVTPLAINFTPVFMDYRHRLGERAAWRLASGVLNSVTLLLLVATAVGLAVREPILRLLAPGLSPEALALADTLAGILWPTVALSGLVQLFTALHQSSDRFAWPAVVAPIGSAASLFLLFLLAPTHGIVGLALATTLGLGLQAVLLLRGAPGARHYWRAGLREAGVAEVLALATPLMCSSVLWNGFPLLERHFASRFGEGAISHLTYGYRIVSAQTLLASAGLATVLFPRFVQQSVSQRLDALRESFADCIRYLSTLLIPLTVWTVVLARPLVQVAFQRGQFHEGDTEQVAGLLQIYAVGLVPMALGTVVGRVLYAMRAMSVVALITVLVALLYWACLVWLPPLWGVPGVAWATVTQLGAGFLLCAGYVHLRTPRPRRSRLVMSLTRTLIAAAVSALPALMLRSRVASAPVLLLISAATVVGVYAAILRALRSEELEAARIALCERVRFLWPLRLKHDASQL